jgi:hypothetical protein
MELIWQRIFNSKLHQNYLNKPNKATNEHIKRTTQILAKRGKASIIDDPAEVKALCKQVVAVSARTIGSP